MSSLNRLIKIMNSVKDVHLRSLCRQVLSNDRFLRGTAACRKHQCYDGGLLDHTCEVVEMALQIAEHRNIKYNRDVLITGAIWHDFGKIFDYAPNKDKKLKQKYVYTRHHELVSHLPRSYGEFMVAARGLISPELADEVGHCILAHHGRLEWGSPIEPNTPEAYAIHAADMMSSRWSVTK